MDIVMDCHTITAINNLLSLRVQNPQTLRANHTIFHSFIHLCKDRNLGYFHLLAIVSTAAVNIGMHTSVGNTIWTVFEYIGRSGTTESYDNLFLNLLGGVTLCSILNIHRHCVRLWVSHIFGNAWYFLF